MLLWQLGIIPQMAPKEEAHTSRQPSELVYELDLDWCRYVLVISFTWNMYRHCVSLTCFCSHCYTCIKTWGKLHIKLYNTQKIRHPARIGRIYCGIDIRDWIYRSCIVIHKSLVLDGSLHYVQCIPYAEILQIFLLFSMIWNCRIQSPAVSKERDAQWCGFWK